MPDTKNAVRCCGSIGNIGSKAEKLSGTLRALNNGDIDDEELDRIVLARSEELSSVPAKTVSVVGMRQRRERRESDQKVKAMAQSSILSERANTSEAYVAFRVDFRI